MNKSIYIITGNNQRVQMKLLYSYIIINKDLQQLTTINNYQLIKNARLSRWKGIDSKES